ncbi:hypothetical protein CbuK_0631 [Coxiella burnetii CbuK_Q154]|nr:hypothetical protein CbuK_0631 [Coxiella burnetii CbuK_Q154]
MVWLTAAFEIPSYLAAGVKPPLSATQRKVSKWWSDGSVMVLLFSFF